MNMDKELQTNKKLQMHPIVIHVLVFPLQRTYYSAPEHLKDLLNSKCPLHHIGPTDEAMGEFIITLLA